MINTIVLIYIIIPCIIIYCYHSYTNIITKAQDTRSSNNCQPFYPRSSNLLKHAHL